MTPMARASAQARGGLVVLLGLSLLLGADPAWAAFGSVGSFCSTSHKGSLDPWPFTTTAQLDAGNLGVIVVATDNLSTTDGNTNDHLSITDTAGNTWTKAREWTNGRGAAAAGVTVSVWYSKAGATLASGATVTVDFTGSINAKAVTCWGFTSGAGSVIQVDGSNSVGDAGPLTLSGLANIQHLWLRGTGAESNATTYTASTNYTAFTHTSSTTSVGGANSNIGARGEFRIFTATSDSTDPSASGTVDHVSTLVALSEVVPCGGVWCYATTATSLAPPGLAPNDVVVAGSNDNKFHGMNAADGTQAFAPFATGGPIQGRAPVIPLEYSSTGLDIAYVTSQDGSVYAVNTNTGAQVWQSPLLGTMLQGGAAVWLQTVQALTIGGAATDAVFVGTRNTCGTTSNKVYALNGKNTTVNGVAPGGILWTFNPDPSPPYSVDCISSTPAVDYWNTAVWVTSRSNGGTTTPSLWKLDAATGAVLASFNLGDIDSSPTPSFDGAFMYVGTNAGTLKVIRISDGTVLTHTPASGTGAIKGLPWPLSYDAVGPATPDTIIFSRDTTVHSVNFDGSPTFTPNWAKTLVSLVQQNTGSALNVSSVTVTLTNPTKVGNLLVMVGAGWCGGLLTPTGGGATTWTKATRSNTNTNIEIWYGVVGTSSSTGVTISMNGCGPTSNGMFMNLTEWSGLHATQSQVLDIPGAANNTTGTASASTGTDTLGDSTPNPTTNANDLLIFGVSQSSGGTFGAPTLGGTPGPWTALTAITTPAKQSAWYQVVSATGTYNPSVSVTTNWDAAIAAFKVATVSAPVDDGAGRLYVGASDGKVHQLAATTGAEQAQVSIVPGAPTVGDPSFDYLLNRIYVGASDGQIYSFGVPF